MIDATNDVQVKPISCKIKLKGHFVHSSSYDDVTQRTGYFSTFPFHFFLCSLLFKGDKGHLKLNETAVPCTSQNANNHVNTKPIQKTTG